MSLYIIHYIQVQLRFTEVQPLHLVAGPKRDDVAEGSLDLVAPDVAPLHRRRSGRVRGERRHLQRRRRHEPLAHSHH